MMKKRHFKRGFAAAFALAMMGLTGCGSKATAKQSNTQALNTYTTEAAYDSPTYQSNQGVRSAYGDAEVSYEEAWDEEVYEYTESKNAVSGTVPTGEGAAGSLPEISDEKLVYQCSMTFESTHYHESVETVRSLIRSNGGFLESENVYTTGGYGDSPTLYVYTATIRVPSTAYQSFLDQTGNIGNLRSQNQNVTNLTQEYYDLSAELEVLETKRQSYLDMMKEANTLEDMETLLMIDDKLTQVEISINRIKTRMQQINNDAAYSYIDISITEVREYQEPAPETFGDRVSRALKNAKNGFLNQCRNLVIWCVRHVIPLGVCLVIILLFWFLVIRRIRKNHKKKAAAHQTAQQQADSPAAQPAAPVENRQAHGPAEQLPEGNGPGQAAE